MFELPEFVTLARQINETLAGKTIRSGALGNSPHKFVWYNRTHEEFAALTAGKTVGAAHVPRHVALHPARARLRAPVRRVRRQVALPPAAGAKLPEKYHLWLAFDDGSALTATDRRCGARWSCTRPGRSRSGSTSRGCGRPRSSPTSPSTTSPR